MDHTEAVVAVGGVDGGEPTVTGETLAAKPFWHSFGQADAKLFWITFGATVGGTITSVITVAIAGLALRAISAPAPTSPEGCIGCPPRVTSPLIPGWAWFTAAVVATTGLLIAVARRRNARGKSPAAPAVIAAAVAVFGILVLLLHQFFS